MSKGGSTTTSVEVPEYIEEAAKRNLTKAERISQLGYVPYYGPDVAAFTPLQEAAFGNVGGQAGAFGLATPAGGAMAGMPAAQEFAGGVRGYSSAPMFEQAQAELAARRPAQKSYIDSFFIDPYTGQYGSNAFTPIDYTTAYPTTPVVTGDTGGGTGGTAPVVTPPSVYIPATDPYGPTVSIPDVLDAYDTLPDSALPPIVPAVGGTNPQVGDVIDNTALRQQQNAIIQDVFENQYGDILNNPNLTPEQKAAANPAFNPEIAQAGQDVDVTITTPTGSYTKKAGDLGSADFAAATGATYVPPATPDGLGEFVGGGTGINTSDLTGQTVPYSDVADLAEQYNLTGKSTTAAGIRNIGGSYAQSPAGSGDLVETRYTPGVGSEIISVTPPAPATYDGSSAKNAAVAKILKDQYGWSDETLAGKGYEGYAPEAPKSTFEAIAVPAAEMKNDIQEQLIGNTIGLFDPTYKVGEINNPIQTPTAPEMIEAAPSGTEYNPTTGSYVRDDTTIDVSTRPVLRPDNLATTQSSPSSSSSKIGTDAGDGMVWAKSSTSNALVRKPAPKSSSSKSSGGGSSSGGGDCVIATHAVASGGFTPSMKREAVVWCMNVLHGKWWGEAIRRGYRYLGKSKIEQGKAQEHYAEFREYIAFANGKKRTLKGALTFAYRTAQFFAVGLVKKDA